MAAPEFSLMGSIDPEITSCVACWKFQGGEKRLKFETGKDAFEMDNLVTVAYERGVIDGQRDVVRAVIESTDQFNR